MDSKRHTYRKDGKQLNYYVSNVKNNFSNVKNFLKNENPFFQENEKFQVESKILQKVRH